MYPDQLAAHRNAALFALDETRRQLAYVAGMLRNTDRAMPKALASGRPLYAIEIDELSRRVDSLVRHLEGCRP